MIDLHRATMMQERQVLEAEIRACTACPLRQEASAPIPGKGPLSPIVIVGQNPGADEDLAGEPFIGKSGRLLDGWLSKVGISRAKAYVTNVVLCHTLSNRAPTRTEAAVCAKRHLVPMLTTLKPRVVVTLGLVASQALLGAKWKMSAHGLVHPHVLGFDVLPTYHPAATIYAGGLKAQWEFDAIQLRRLLESYRHQDKEEAQNAQVPLEG